MGPGEWALVVVIVAMVALFAIEIWAIRTHRPTISEWWQRLMAAMDKQLIAGLFFLAGAIAGWFIAHYTSAPPR